MPVKLTIRLLRQQETRLYLLVNHSTIGVVLHTIIQSQSPDLYKIVKLNRSNTRGLHA